MSDWSQELAKAKAERRTPAPDRMPPNMKPAAKKRKKPKARFHVMWQSNLGGILKGGMVVGRYKTMEEALACIERKVRSAYVPSTIGCCWMSRPSAEPGTGSKTPGNSPTFLSGYLATFCCAVNNFITAIKQGVPTWQRPAPSPPRTMA